MEAITIGNTKVDVAASKDLPAVVLEANAIAHIKRLLAENDMPGFGLRYGLQGGGCSGYSYLMEFEEAPQAEDEVFEFDGVRVFMNPLHIEYLRGSTIDYSDTLIGAGFQIKNPNVKRQCGCGSSFDV
ncbi:MAG: iron-sulfur cluster assembly accessory protein [Pseudomonadota bacterium]|nr:iron-sulfur cluster assembly accessory protein [Pseudomonadota bacterium]